MQLDRMLDFHKALADANRLKIILLLAVKPLSGKELAEKLALSPATVTHHMQLLQTAAIVAGKRDKNTIYFYLNEKELAYKSHSILRRVEQVKQSNLSDREKTLHHFFDEQGCLKTIPSQRKKKLFVFEHMLQGLEHGRAYTEPEINEYIKRYHEDFCTIRREFIMNSYMTRENGVYTLNPQELWARID